jgi:bifunctional DNA primase/polymerase-like protein
LIANDPFGAVFGIATPGDNSPDTVIRVAKAAARAGIAVLIIDPTSKVPVCPLAARAAKLADQAAQDAGTGTRHDCGVGHASKDPTELDRWLKRLTKDGRRFNLAVVPGLSRLVAIDVDTAAELAGWICDRAREDRIPDDERHLIEALTVMSPGQRSTATGEMVHKDGGHIWFTLPEGVDLAGSPVSKYAAESGWVAMFGPRAYVLVPPSNRTEGPYTLVGQAEEAPAWLLERIGAVVQETTERRERQANRVAIEDDPIDRWAATTTWAELIEPDGWTATGKPDSCSPDCMIWTRPGSAAHAKSATAHAEGCGRYDLRGGHGPLHFWTDVRPDWIPAGSRTVSKLQWVAYRDHGGDMGAAMRSLGLGRAGATEWREVPEEWPEGASAERPGERKVSEDVSSPGAISRPLTGPAMARPGANKHSTEDPGPPEELSEADIIRASDPDRAAYRERMSPAGETAPLFDVEPSQTAPVPTDAASSGREARPDAVASVPPAQPGDRPTLGDDAWHGIAAEIVRVLEPSTEADPAAVLFVLLSMLGNYVGRKPHLWAGATDHPPRLWPLLVGKTGAGKKGTAVNVAAWFMRQYDEEYMRDNLTSGLSTAEGLIQEVADPKPEKGAEGAEDGFDPGLVPPDKRRIFREDEFATLLGRSRRENNVISAAVREAYDGVPMRVKTRTDPLVATDHHISIIGAITPEELLAKLSDTDVANGFANRFLVVYSSRSKSLPRDVPFDRAAVNGLLTRLDRTVRAVAGVRGMGWTELGAKAWDEYYLAMDSRNLPGGRTADLVNRWNANTLRLAVTYALLDGLGEVDEVHVRAAIACWHYIEASIRAIFDDETADRELQRLMEYIDQAPEPGWRSRNDVYAGLFAKHIGKAELDALLEKLCRTGKYEGRKVQAVDEATGKPKGGRPTWVYGRRTKRKDG